jgi:hypothetical protein
MASNHPPQPRATVLTFGRFLNRPPLERAAMVGQVRRSREAKSGFNPYAKFVAAVQADLSFGTPGTHRAAAVQTVDPRYRALYQELDQGIGRYFETLPNLAELRAEKVRSALVARSGLVINLNPQLGLRYPDGHVEAVYLWFDEQEPHPETVLALLHLMDQQMADIHPDATACLLDVRRGDAHYLTPTPAHRIDRFIDGQAAAFVANWGAAAVAA